MKVYHFVLLGLLAGAVAAMHTFAILFNTPTAQLFPEILAPAMVAAASSLLLSWLAPGQWKILATAVALPTLLMAALLFIALWREGRADWGWPLVAAAALSVCFLAGWLAVRIASRRARI